MILGCGVEELSTFRRKVTFVISVIMAETSVDSKQKPGFAYGKNTDRVFSEHFAENVPSLT
jgi:hypothetical protein